MAATISAVGMDDGAVSRGVDRYEELICDGENPRTILVGLRSMAATHEIGREDVAFAAGLIDLLADEESSLTSATVSVGGGVTRTGGKYG